ncbi:MAG: hypothetical protein EBX65_03100, partial [Betaproteobacteria bacterium]|nr:hypothetical protein [Betaproteobacteria bacterium]
ARSPTIPSCQASLNTTRLGASPATSSKPSRACCCISACRFCRSRLIRSSSRANAWAVSACSASKHSMPTLMSFKRPAALMRGASANPRSATSRLCAFRPAMLMRAFTPAWALPCRIRCSPAWTSARLLPSSLTRSATVPKATRSN